MEYVKMPEIMSAEAVKVLAGNMASVKDLISSREVDSTCHHEDTCCPKKVKFIFVLNNVVIINENAVAAEDNHGPAPC